MANYKKNQILIGDAGNIDNFLKQIGGTLDPNYHPSFINSRLINLPDTISVDDAIKKFNQSGLGGYAEPNFSISVPEPLFRGDTKGNYPVSVSKPISTTTTSATSTVATPQTPNQSNIWQDTWQTTGNPYSEAWKNISPNIGTKESTPSNTTVNTTNPVSGQGNFPKLPNITKDVMQELDSLNGVNTWGNFKTTGLGNQANPNYTESKGYYVNPYTGEYSF